MQKGSKKVENNTSPPLPFKGSSKHPAVRERKWVCGEDSPRQVARGPDAFS